MRTIIVLLVIVSFIVPATGSIPVEGEKFSLITLREARDLHGKSGVYFVDVNEPEIYQRHHVPGATLVTSEELRKFLPNDKQSTLVFYCAERRCTASQEAAHEAVKLGYTKVFVMFEGIFGWVKAGLPVEQGAENVHR